MKRSNHLGRCGLVVVLCMTMIWSACSTSWIGEAEQIVTALIPAASNVVALVAAMQGKSVSAGDLAMILKCRRAGWYGLAAHSVADRGLSEGRRCGEARDPEPDSERDQCSAGESAGIVAGTAY